MNSFCTGKACKFVVKIQWKLTRNFSVCVYLLACRYGCLYTITYIHTRVHIYWFVKLLASLQGCAWASWLGHIFFYSTSCFEYCQQHRVPAARWKRNEVCWWVSVRASGRTNGSSSNVWQTPPMYLIARTGNVEAFLYIWLFKDSEIE